MDQSSGFSEKALFRMETQLKSTTLTHPISPVKNMPTSTFLLQNIRVSLIDTTHPSAATVRKGTGFVP